MSEPTTLSILSPGERALPLSPGVRVRAVWAQTLAEGAALLGAAERIESYYNVLYEEDVFFAARFDCSRQIWRKAGDGAVYDAEPGLNWIVAGQWRLK